MIVPWNELAESFGGPEKIPDAGLYEYITTPEVFDRLTGADKKAVPKTGLGQEVIRRSKSDLYWLAKYFLHDTNPEMAGKPISDCAITKNTHQRVCDMFAHKGTGLAIADLDGPDWRNKRKERIILYPRCSFKSTMQVADSVQWILNYPEIRILYLTAEEDLAVGKVDEIKGHFLKKLYEPSFMNIFFPEFCLDEKELAKENAYEFTCPIWKKKQVRRTEPTVMARSILSTLSGLHFEVLKADDIVSNKNSENEEQCKKVIKNFGINVKMLRTFGYLEVVGTRYDESDLYGDALRKNVGDIDTNSGPCWTSFVNKTNGMKILIGRAWQLKPEVQKDIDDSKRRMDEVQKVDYDFIFPEVLSYEFLLDERNRWGEASFEGQYNQNPRQAVDVAFPRVLLVKHTIPYNELPTFGPISQTWDFAYSKKKDRDYCTASTVVWNDKGQMYVLDLIRAKFSATELAQAVVDFAKKWRPFVIGIEDIAGSRFIEPTLISEAQKSGRQDVLDVIRRIDWYKPSTNKDAKKARMASLHPWLTGDRMWFSAHVPFREIIYEEFEVCLSGGKHDDIPDVLSYQTKYAPAIQQNIQKTGMSTLSKEDAAYNMMYANWISDGGVDAFGRLGRGEEAPQTIVVSTDTEPETQEQPNPYGIPSFMGGAYGV